MDRIAAIALGSNLGDRQAHLDYAARRLRTLLRNLSVSGYVETEPEEVDTPQPRYLNGAAVGETSLSARELLARSAGAGRSRP